MKKHLLLVISSLAIVSFIGVSASFIQSNPQNMDKGIGPVKNVELGPINKKMVDEGKKIYIAKCIVCHELDQKKIGPPLRNITKERTPEYFINLLLNPEKMLKENSIMKGLLKKYNNIPMPNPNLNQTQSRSVLEYMRSVAK